MGLGVVLLVDDVEEDGVDDDTAVDVDTEAVRPPEDLGGAGDVNGGVEGHLTAGGVGEESRDVVGELEAVKAGREVEELAGHGGLGAGVEEGGAEVGAGVKYGDDGGSVVDGDEVGVGDVDGEGEVDVEEGEVEAEGGEGDGDEVEGGVSWPTEDDDGGRRSRGGAHQGGAPAPASLSQGHSFSCCCVWKRWKDRRAVGLRILSMIRLMDG